MSATKAIDALFLELAEFASVNTPLEKKLAREVADARHALPKEIQAKFRNVCCGYCMGTDDDMVIGIPCIYHQALEIIGELPT